MRNKAFAILLSVCFLFLSACNNAQKPPQEKSSPPQAADHDPTKTQLPPEFSSTTEHDPTPTPMPPDIQNDDEQTEAESEQTIFQIFENAMAELVPDVEFDISGVEWQYGAENDLRNIYYSVLHGRPELKYTYDIEVSVLNDTAFCKFLYMPYKIGAYADSLPAGSHTITCVRDAKIMAQSMIDGTERLSIAITDPNLLVEDIQLALAQAGYGWIRFDLSRDGTEIIAQTPVGKSLEECVTAINESFQLGTEILAELIMEDMTKQEKAAAIYDYIIENVAYDFRYYSDPSSMPFESTVAMGALRDDLAICGGYAQAFETLLTMAGIENYTVSGTSNGEYHMWNYVVMDGIGYYCDPTADRGSIKTHFMLSADDLTALGDYSWNQEFLSRISGT